MFDILLHTFYGALLLAFIAWNAFPVLYCLYRREPRAVRSMLEASVKGPIRAAVGALAPFVMLVVLPFVPRSAEKLPDFPLLWMWDNDVSINGDRGDEVYWLDWKWLQPLLSLLPLRFRDNRSFLARYVWLGWRNRASALAQRLGYTYAEGEEMDMTFIGNVSPSTIDYRDNTECWVIGRRGKAWQLYILVRVGKKRCIVVSYGYKLWVGANTYDGRKTANVVNTAFSLPRWKGAM